VSIPDARRCRAAGRDSWGPSSSLERKKRKSRAIARRGTVLIHSHTQHFYDRGSLFYCLNPSTVSPLSAPSVPRFAYISSETIVCDIPPFYISSRLHTKARAPRATTSHTETAVALPSEDAGFRHSSRFIPTKRTQRITQHHIMTMECQLRPTDVPTIEYGMDFGWHPDVYSKLIGNGEFTSNATSAGMQCMTSVLDVSTK
jgi:hypothetical protein